MADRSWRSNSRRPGFSRRAQYGLFFGYVVAVAGVLVGIALVLLARLDPPGYALVRGAALDIGAPVTAAGRAGVRGVEGAIDGIGDYFFAASQNATLRQELAVARRKLAAARVVAFENRRLRGLLHVVDGAQPPVTAARITGSTLASGRRYATLTAGRVHGVRPGQPVRSADGLVGRVADAGAFTARVMLLTDASSVVPVRILRGNIAALAAGRGDGTIEIRPLGAGNNPFRRGDLAVTSGAGGVYPANVPVAVVARIERDVAIGWPLADPARLDFAIVDRVIPTVAPPPPVVTPAR